MDDLREVLADELPAARHFVVNLQRQVQCQLGQFDRLPVIRGSQVVVHVAQNIFETIFEIDVVGFHIVLGKPSVEIVFDGRRVEDSARLVQVVLGAARQNEHSEHCRHK